MTEEIGIFQQGESVGIIATYTTQAGVASNPIQGVTVTVIDSEGTTQVDAVAMSTSVTGTYTYEYNLGATAAKGWWRTQTKAQEGTGDTARYVIQNGGFTVE